MPNPIQVGSLTIGPGAPDPVARYAGLESERTVYVQFESGLVARLTSDDQEGYLSILWALAAAGVPEEDGWQS